MDINWDTYAETFPVRYLRTGPFDFFLTCFLAERGWTNPNPPPWVCATPAPTQTPLRVLEIGGGTRGCPSLDVLKEKPEVWFLDPFVSKVPEWVTENLGWDTEQQFDLVLARGSVNYLSPEELRKIPSLLLPGGTFLANTFEHIAPEGMRKVFGVNHTEWYESYQVKPPNVIHHTLTPVEGGEPIEHTFFKYSRENFRSFLGECSFAPYSENSLRLSIP